MNGSEPTIFGDHDERVLAQLERCVGQEDGSIGVLCADGHFGYGAPIGAVLAYRAHVSPAAVGYDIGCGNLATLTDLAADDLRPDIAGIMDRIFAEVSFGVGRRDGRAADHPIVERIRHADFGPQRRLANTAADQLGTVGAGNHYVDVFSDERDRVWVGVHFGSRGFGHRTASGFLSIARGRRFEDRVGKSGMEDAPDLIPLASDAGQSYMAAMELAGAYAHAGREVVVDQVLDILGARPVESVHNHHNYAWRETHGGEDLYVIRKGASPSAPGQRSFVGATMGEPSVILVGVESERSAHSLYSTVHGAGRAMSRTMALGARRMRLCCRACDWVWRPRRGKASKGKARKGKPRECPKCRAKLERRLVQEAEGAIDWPATLADLRAKGIELRGGAADEAPGAYKRLDAVLAAHAGTVEIQHTLTPMGVAMAGPDTDDPWRD